MLKFFCSSFISLISKNKVLHFYLDAAIGLPILLTFLLSHARVLCACVFFRLSFCSSSIFARQNLCSFFTSLLLLESVNVLLALLSGAFLYRTHIPVGLLAFSHSCSRIRMPFSLIWRFFLLFVLIPVGARHSKPR